MSTWNLPPGVTTNDPHINPPEFSDDDYDGTIIGACNLLKIAYPVSATDLHEVYIECLAEGLAPWTILETKCWRGVCDCLDLYNRDEPGHTKARQIIMEHLEMLLNASKDDPD